MPKGNGVVNFLSRLNAWWGEGLKNRRFKALCFCLIAGCIAGVVPSDKFVTKEILNSHFQVLLVSAGLVVAVFGIFVSTLYKSVFDALLDESDDGFELSEDESDVMASFEFAISMSGLLLAICLIGKVGAPVAADLFVNKNIVLGVQGYSFGFSVDVLRLGLILLNVFIFIQVYVVMNTMLPLHLFGVSLKRKIARTKMDKKRRARTNKKHNFEED